MTQEEKIAALVEHIKKEFPNGCKGIEWCSECPLHRSSWKGAGDLCELLDNLHINRSHVL